jgi:hypothetical protein
MQIRECYIGDDLGVSTVSTSARIYNVIDKDYTRVHEGFSLPVKENEILNLVVENTMKSLENE